MERGGLSGSGNSQGAALEWGRGDPLGVVPFWKSEARAHLEGGRVNAQHLPLLRVGCLEGLRLVHPVAACSAFFAAPAEAPVLRGQVGVIVRPGAAGGAPVRDSWEITRARPFGFGAFFFLQIVFNRCDRRAVLFQRAGAVQVV